MLVAKRGSHEIWCIGQFFLFEGQGSEEERQPTKVHCFILQIYIIESGSTDIYLLEFFVEKDLLK